MARTARPVVALSCLLAALVLAGAAGATVRSTDRRELTRQTPPGQGTGALATATLEHCDTASLQSERSIGVVAEMNAIPHTARMAIRIEIQERLPEATDFRTVKAPGLGVWRKSDRGVSSYKYLNKVTDLSAPAVYRGAVRFRWLDGRGHPIKTLERHTPSCTQPARMGPA
jgi:hypothetical protein